VVIDPWFTGNPAATTTADELGSFDVLLLTHGHSDHIGDVAAVVERGSPSAVLTLVELGGYLERKGIQNITAYNKGGTVEAAGIRFTMVPASHSSSMLEDDGTYIYLGDPVGYVITLEDGFRIYFAGDTSVSNEMQLIGRMYKPDVAVLPIGGFYTMDPFQAAEAVRLLGVRKVIPTHYGTFDLLAGTPDQLRSEASDVEGLEVLDVKPGETVK
jgi:L-ascorbate metabolism protein UlaG (beta-lactamase superfamily)